MLLFCDKTVARVTKITALSFIVFAGIIWVGGEKEVAGAMLIGTACASVFMVLVDKLTEMW